MSSHSYFRIFLAEDKKQNRDFIRYIDNKAIVKKGRVTDEKAEDWFYKNVLTYVKNNSSIFLNEEYTVDDFKLKGVFKADSKKEAQVISNYFCDKFNALNPNRFNIPIRKIKDISFKEKLQEAYVNLWITIARVEYINKFTCLEYLDFEVEQDLKNFVEAVYDIKRITDDKLKYNLSKNKTINEIDSTNFLIKQELNLLINKIISCYDKVLKVLDNQNIYFAPLVLESMIDMDNVDFLAYMVSNPNFNNAIWPDGFAIDFNDRWEFEDSDLDMNSKNINLLVSKTNYKGNPFNKFSIKVEDSLLKYNFNDIVFKDVKNIA